MIRLDMDGDQICSRGNKTGQVVIRARNHQMHIEKNVVALMHSLNDCGTKGNVVHKSAVHDIQVQPLRTRRFSPLNLGADLGPV